jgi:hypothetical protein
VLCLIAEDRTPIDTPLIRITPTWDPGKGHFEETYEWKRDAVAGVRYALLIAANTQWHLDPEKPRGTIDQCIVDVKFSP